MLLQRCSGVWVVLLPPPEEYKVLLILMFATLLRCLGGAGASPRIESVVYIVLIVILRCVDAARASPPHRNKKFSSYMYC